MEQQVSVKARLFSSYCNVFHSSMWVAFPKRQGWARVNKLANAKVNKSRSSLLRHVLLGGGGPHVKTTPSEINIVHKRLIMGLEFKV